MKITVADIAKLVGGEVVGDAGRLVSGFSGIKEAKKDDLTFLANPKYEPLLLDTHAGVSSCSPADLLSGENCYQGSTIPR
jgi:UDP-3-O-[3-hydroxymyristoyl] glucosamine N-acyltransferase